MDSLNPMSTRFGHLIIDIVDLNQGEAENLNGDPELDRKDEDEVSGTPPREIPPSMIINDWPAIDFGD